MVIPQLARYIYLSYTDTIFIFEKERKCIQYRRIAVKFLMVKLCVLALQSKKNLHKRVSLCQSNTMYFLFRIWLIRVNNWILFKFWPDFCLNKKLVVFLKMKFSFPNSDMMRNKQLNVMDKHQDNRVNYHQQCRNWFHTIPVCTKMWVNK